MIELINTHIDLPSLSSEFARLTESQIALIADPCFGRLPSRPRLPFRAESVVLMTPRNTRAIGLQPCESMVCKFPITQSESVDPGVHTLRYTPDWPLGLDFTLEQPGFLGLYGVCCHAQGDGHLRGLVESQVNPTDHASGHIGRGAHT
jgi:hypothetical protein